MLKKIKKYININILFKEKKRKKINISKNTILFDNFYIILRPQPKIQKYKISSF